jgi:hypothetical protein
MMLQRLAVAVPKRYSNDIAQRFLAAGRYSRLMDLGGAPSSTTDPSKITAPNLNKNCHLQYVIFDFEVLCRSMQDQDPTTGTSSNAMATTPTVVAPMMAPVQPDVDRVLELAQLLKVDIAGRNNKDHPLVTNQTFDDDLSLLTTGSEDASSLSSSRPPTKLTPHHNTTKPLSAASPMAGTADLRLKYADKLRQKTGGGVATVDDNARDELVSSKRGGDAEFHFAARQHAMAQSSSTTSTRWMAGTGTGQLLSFLHSRSFKVVLLPTPVEQVQKAPSPSHQAEAQSMDELVQQLQSKLSFHSVIHQTGSLTVERIFTDALADTVTMRDRCLCVSDRDSILKGAKEAGMLTLRIRPPNARRGNVSTNYTAETVMETQTIVNEINGISFSSVLQQGY